MWLLEGLHVVGWPLLLGIGLEAAGGQAWIGRRLPAAWRARLRPQRVVPACLMVLHACVAAILVYAAVALARPALTEWVEAAVAAIAEGWAAGGSIYPDSAAPGKYAVFPYGPLLFQAVGAIYAASGGSGKAVQAAYVGLALFTYALMFLVLRRERLGPRQSALAVEFLAVVVGIMGFMVKADIMLVLVAVLACGMVAFSRRQLPMGVGLAVLGGIAAAIKIHGALYVLPAAVECLALRPRQRALKLAAAGALAAAVAAAPFLVPGTSLDNYVFVLRTASHDGLLFGAFLSNIAFIALCVLAVYGIVPAPARDAAYRRLMASVLAAGLIVSVVAAKSEAGPHHLIPLLPYLCLPLGRALAERCDARRAMLFVLFLVSFQPITSIAGDLLKMTSSWLQPIAVI